MRTHGDTGRSSGAGYGSDSYKKVMPNNLQLLQTQTGTSPSPSPHIKKRTYMSVCVCVCAPVYLFPLQMSLLCARVTKSLRLKRICM